MTNELTFADYAARLRAFSASGCPQPDAAFNELALALFQLQFTHNTPYRRLCEFRGVKSAADISRWEEIPAVPTSAFKELELTSLAPDERTACFFSSGTTEQRRSRHFHSAESLAIYEASLLPWFERHLLADLNDLMDEQLLGPLDKLPMLALTPPPAAAPNSSLVHMFDTVRREFGARDSLFAGLVVVGQAPPPVIVHQAPPLGVRPAGALAGLATGEGASPTTASAGGAWTLDLNSALFAIRKSMCANRPLMLLGTAFNFVHLLDHFAVNNMRYKLARGSRVLETGGYKGQSREVPKAELHALITKHLGIAPENIVTEYGMSELSSQAYDRVAGEVQGPRSKAQGQASVSPQVTLSPCPRAFHFPPWCRARVISPETGLEVAEGETGLLRLFDLANVRSVLAIQTEDLTVKRGDGFELLGRATQAEPRGCSLMSLDPGALR